MFKVLNSCFLSVDLFCKWLFFFLRSQVDPDMLKPSLMELKMEPDIEQVRAASCCSSALNDYAHFGAHRLLHIFSARIKLCFYRAACQHTWPRVFFRRRKWSQSCCANLAAHLIVHLPYILPYIFLFNSICFRSCRAPFILSVMNYHNAFRVDHHAAFHVEHFPR